MKSANQILAENLTRLMGSRYNNSSLGKAAKMAPNTIKNYRDPDRDGSANLSDLEKLSKALKVPLLALITEGAVHGEEEPSQSAGGAMAMVHEAIDMLEAILAGMDDGGREIAASALGRFAKNPHSERARCLKAFEAALEPIQPDPSPPVDETVGAKRQAAKAALRGGGRANLVVKVGGGQRQQFELPLPGSLRPILSNQSASPRELEFHERVRAYPRANSEPKPKQLKNLK